MNCEKYLFLIDDLIENELNAPIAAQTDAHIFACENCRAEYESLKQEKEIYAHFLFDIEPPQNLLENFQTRLAAEREKTFDAVIMPKAESKKTGVFDFLRIYPALAAMILIIFGIGFVWLKFAPIENDNQYTAETKLDLPSKNGADEKSERATASSKIKNIELTQQAKNIKIGGKTEVSKPRRAAFSAVKKPIPAQIVKIKQKTVSDRAEKNPLIAKLPDEAKRQRLQVKNLEKEIAGQIEKIELLLRSFRNAREIENVETFDLQYEKRQARALLAKNARLRLDAENFGVFYAEELLSRAEPYLLDIANLENNPGRAEVLDIKERVKNHSIIASLQIY
jgi:5'-deoxynucleotidase YfbR-like HD superfamily hydrolase